MIKLICSCRNIPMEANKVTLFWECPSCSNRISLLKVYEITRATEATNLIIPGLCPIFLNQEIKP